jgi:exosome complex component RRP4
MPITILKPQPAAQRPLTSLASPESDSDSEGGVDIQGDVSMGGTTQKGDVDPDEILTPGTIITSNPQWMRYVPRAHEFVFPSCSN